MIYLPSLFVICEFNHSLFLLVYVMPSFLIQSLTYRTTRKGAHFRCHLISFFFPRFEDYFSNRVKQLTFTFPEDAATSTGAPFWSAPKRFPRPLEFSTTDLSHVQFIMAASILRAVSFGITVPDWAKSTTNLIDAISKVYVPEFKPKSGVKIETDEKANNISSASVDDAAVIEDLLAKLEASAKKLPPGFRLKPIHFEKVSLSKASFCRFKVKTLCFSLFPCC